MLSLLWVTIGLTVAAPQLDFGDSRSVVPSLPSSNVDQNQVVTDVVFALQPEIERAVAAALAGIRQSSSSSTGFAAGGFSSSNSASSAAAAENNAR